MKIIGKIFAVFYSMIYFFVLFALLIVSFSLNLLSGSYYSNIAKSIDLKTVKVSDFGIVFNNSDFDENMSVEDALVTYFTEGGVNEDVAIAAINNETVREIAGEFIGEYVNYNVTGEKPEVSKDDILTVLNESDVKKLLDSSNIEIDMDVDKIYDQVNDFIDEMVKGGTYYDSKRSIGNSISD